MGQNPDEVLPSCRQDNGSQPLCLQFVVAPLFAQYCICGEGSISGEVLMLLFFVLSTGGKVLAVCTSTALAWIVILLTLWDVLSPLLVSSSQSMLSEAKVVKTPGWVFAGRTTSFDTESVCRHKAVPIYSILEWDGGSKIRCDQVG